MGSKAVYIILFFSNLSSRQPWQEGQAESLWLDQGHTTKFYGRLWIQTWISQILVQSSNHYSPLAHNNVCVCVL